MALPSVQSGTTAFASQRFTTGDPTMCRQLNAMQDGIATALRPLQARPDANGQLIQGQTFTSGAPVIIEHGLGQAWAGFEVWSLEGTAMAFSAAHGTTDSATIAVTGTAVGAVAATSSGMAYTLAGDSKTVTGGGGSGASSVIVPIAHSSQLVNAIFAGNKFTLSEASYALVVGELSLALAGLGSPGNGWLSIFHSGTLVPGSLTEGLAGTGGWSCQCIVKLLAAGDTIALYFDDATGSTWGINNASITVTPIASGSGGSGTCTADVWVYC